MQRHDAGPGGGRNGRGETSKKVVESGRDWQISEHDGSFSAYMEAKNQKLRIQFDQKKRREGTGSDLFGGICIHVNGYTVPSHSELKDIMAEQGGSFENYFSSERVTHIICSNLTDQKLKLYAKERNPVPVVHPNWIVESIRAGTLLPHTNFLLDRLRKDRNQRVLDLPRRYECQPSVSKRNDQGTAGGTSPMKKEKDFVDTFFKNSRLHFIGSWKAKLASVMSAASALDCPKPKAPGKGKRQIIHIDIDSFFASVAVLMDPSLEGKPIAVCHSDHQRGGAEISSCSYQARAFGVKAGMFISTAKELCPGLLQAPYHFEKYQEVSIALYRILLEFSSCVQPVSIDEAYMDVTGLGDTVSICDDIRSRFYEQTGVRVSTGASHNMLLAKIATTRAKPDGRFLLPPESAKDFLKDLPVKEIPGVGYKMGKKLADMGVNQCADVWAASKDHLQHAFGSKTGHLIWEYAHGRDDRCVTAETKRQSIGAEINWGIRFSSMEDAVRTLERLSEEVEARLRQTSAKGRCVALKLKMRKPNAPPPPKYMGHGWCDNISRSVTLASSVGTRKDIAREAVALLSKLEVDPCEIRGLGIQITKLDLEVDMGSKRKRTNTNQQQDLLSAYERPKKAKGVRVKGGDPSGEEKIRLSDIDVNEQKYILSMIKVREREQTKRKLFWRGASTAGEAHAAAAANPEVAPAHSGGNTSDDEGAGSLAEAKRGPHQEMVEGILSSRYAFQVCDVIVSARGEGVPGALLAYALAAMETDVERVRRLLRALHLLKEKGEARGMSPDQVEALQTQISEEVRRAYGGALLV